MIYHIVLVATGRPIYDEEPIIMETLSDWYSSEITALHCRRKTDFNQSQLRKQLFQLTSFIP